MASARRTYSASVLLASDYESFKQQESIFVVLNLFVLATLLLLHSLFASHWGNPSATLISVLATAFLAEAGELIWLQGREQPLGQPGIMLLTAFSIVINFFLAFLLAELSHREDTQYFILMVVPVLESAFRLPLLPMLTVVAFADFTNIFWVWHYGQRHPPVTVGEYFEAGTVSLIYTLVGILVWLLVKQLALKEMGLSQSLNELERTRERLLREERLAAVGRLSSAIAHEIRNPVAVISSALSTAGRSGLELAEREEMFGIAAQEAARLERLTTDFLAYARPRGPQMAPASLADTLGYVCSVCRPRSAEKGVVLEAEDAGPLEASIDAGQIHQALINLILNAVEATPPAARVTLRAAPAGNGLVRIDVENESEAIPAATAAQIFEPFFTTKPGGTGLGLAIARNIARAHGGDLVLAVNQPGRVCFSLTLPAAPPAATST